MYLNLNVLGTTHTARSVVHLSALSTVTATVCIKDKFCTHSALYLKSGPNLCIFKVINSEGLRESESHIVPISHWTIRQSSGMILHF